MVFREERVRIGIITGFGSRKYMGYDVPTMELDWKQSSDGSGGSSGYVHLHARIFIKLFDES